MAFAKASYEDATLRTLRAGATTDGTAGVVAPALLVGLAVTRAVVGRLTVSRGNDPNGHRQVRVGR